MINNAMHLCSRSKERMLVIKKPQPPQHPLSFLLRTAAKPRCLSQATLSIRFISQTRYMSSSNHTVCVDIKFPKSQFYPDT
jgi:hypothetical protein